MFSRNESDTRREKKNRIEEEQLVLRHVTRLCDVVPIYHVIELIAS